MIWVGHESRRTMSRYNVRTLRRVQAALERVIAFENPRNTRAGETGGGTRHHETDLPDWCEPLLQKFPARV